MTECVDGVVRGGPVSRRMEDLCLEEKLDRALLNNPGNKTSSKDIEKERKHDSNCVHKIYLKIFWIPYEDRAWN